MTKVTQLSVDQSGGVERRRIHLREISGEADAPLETVGQDLRAARLRRGEDLATAARTLKIRRDHLEALEEDRLAALPGRTYAVGFVRAYAEYLGLDPLQTVERFKHEIAGRDDASKTAGFPEQSDETRLPHGWIIIAVIVLGLVAYGLYHLAISADTAAQQQPVAAVPEQILSKARVAAIPHKPALPKPAAAPASSTTPAAGTPPSTAPANGTDAAAALPETSPVTGHVYGQQNATARVVLHVKEATRILVQDEGGRVFINRALEPGDTYQVPNVPGLLLTAQHGNAVEVDLDGQSMGLASSDADPSEALSLDPQAISDRYNTGRHG